jgi:hypothetical protein
MVLPVKQSPAEVNDHCGKCHRHPGDLDGRAPEMQSQLARFPGPALAMSRCFTESAGKLTCITCHNPHETVRHGRTAYDAACRGCHGAPPQTLCAAKRTSECAGCHMPDQSVAGKLHLRFHNHWIRASIPEGERARSRFP